MVIITILLSHGYLIPNQIQTYWTLSISKVMKSCRLALKLSVRNIKIYFNTLPAIPSKMEPFDIKVDTVAWKSE
jgi:hypothetical protein